MNDWAAVVISFILIVIATSVDPAGFERICNDPHVKCEVK